jgi:hypothetical protein
VAHVRIRPPAPEFSWQAISPAAIPHLRLQPAAQPSWMAQITFPEPDPGLWWNTPPAVVMRRSPHPPTTLPPPLALPGLALPLPAVSYPAWTPAVVRRLISGAEAPPGVLIFSTFAWRPLMPGWLPPRRAPEGQVVSRVQPLFEGICVALDRIAVRTPTLQAVAVQTSYLLTPAVVPATLSGTDAC